ncbi:gliding motility-associated ABC transporter substrate-binding protein GldG [Dysgonomonas sp. 520]|uniref:gliding motility-associated ABC transporter substrate-binding protein GldG n=1 Tax=Dysgonomonas sp. 520 TaxID=2302931 RepID=UPI0013D312FC|nr:gliding motility-associated ABC transporter substrate-binding protein GldG [Dysgonomonas sp. 520]NDW10747.1 gliding motility-associated ABC transporter substrate-binding protein GldG [Dysgonomonas sp. 520]
MKSLLKKEFIHIVCSSSGIVFSFAYLLICGLFLWLFQGSFNIPDANYSSLDSFFRLSALLFIVLIPALTMGSFSEERKSNTLNLLLSRPKKIVTIISSKILSSWMFATICILATFVYIITISDLSIPKGNIDLHNIIICYALLIFLSLVFVSIGVFSSTLTSNQILALLLSIFLNAFFFFGFDMIGYLFGSPKAQLSVSSFGLNSHYTLMQRGVVQLNDILAFFNYIAVFVILSVFVLDIRKTLRLKRCFIGLGILVAVNIIASFIPNYRFDFTEDKKYTLSDYSKKILANIAEEKKDIQVNIFLEGDLNSGFQKLQNSVKDLLSDFNRKSNGAFNVKFINPYNNANSPKEVYEYMAQQQMEGIILNETNREGKVSQKIIYPYAQIVYDNDTLPINLLKRITTNSAEENLNASAENLEFEFIDAIRLISRKEKRDIAFIEGHGEIAEPYLEDATAMLSKYFFINRGTIIPDVSVLNSFSVVIIAGATEKFSEQEKFILDQYIMNGGKVLWLMDGVYYSKEDLARKGESPGMKNETNLDDLLFTYGVRINPVLLQDAQCLPILLASDNENAKPTVVPSFFSPLLIPSPNHPVTKDISDVAAYLSSSVDIVGKSENVSKTVLLTTSTHSHTVRVPEKINFEVEHIQSQPDYFDESFIPVAIALDGQFNSAYKNRMIPDSIDMREYKPRFKSSRTKMIVVGNSEIIRNSYAGQDDETMLLPMGYDRIERKQYGNRDFIVNAVNWLANDDEWMSLRNKQQQLRLLNKQLIYENRDKYVAMNIALPLLIMALIIGCINLLRKFKYER